MVEQNGSVYESNFLGITFVPNVFSLGTYSGTFSSANFTKIAGTGPANPNFSGATATRFGFNAGNTGSGPSLTMYYDNFRLFIPAATDIPPAPEPASLAAWTGLGMLSLLAARRRRQRSS